MSAHVDDGALVFRGRLPLAALRWLAMVTIAAALALTDMGPAALEVLQHTGAVAP